MAGRPARCSCSATAAARSRAYGRFYLHVEIDGVELDPTVTAAGRGFLGLGDNPKLHTITVDGRDHLEQTAKRYDLIAIDA